MQKVTGEGEAENYCCTCQDILNMKLRQSVCTKVVSTEWNAITLSKICIIYQN